jgi:hypothetical protein
MEGATLSFDLTTFDWTIAGATFVAYLAVDALYAIYTIEVVRLRPARAATTGALIYVLSAFGIVNLVHNALYIIPLALGGWLGTFIVVWVQGRRPQHGHDVPVEERLVGGGKRHGELQAASEESAADREAE